MPVVVLSAAVVDSSYLCTTVQTLLKKAGPPQSLKGDVDGYENGCPDCGQEG